MESTSTFDDMMSEENENEESEVEIKPWRGKRLRSFSDYHLQMSADLFAQSIELARLAVDLARLDWQQNQSKKTPGDFIGDAAELVNKAARKAAFHPELFVKESIAATAAQRAKKNVPFEKIVGQHGKPVLVPIAKGKNYSFEPFITERGFSEFVSKHFRRLIELECSKLVGSGGSSLKAVLVQCFSAGPEAVQEGQSLVESSYYECRAHLIPCAVESVKPGKGLAFGERVFLKWLELAAEEAAEQCKSNWRKAGVPMVDLVALAETRNLANKSKGRKKQGAAGREMS